MRIVSFQLKCAIRLSIYTCDFFFIQDIFIVRCSERDREDSDPDPAHQELVGEMEHMWDTCPELCFHEMTLALYIKGSGPRGKVWLRAY